VVPPTFAPAWQPAPQPLSAMISGWLVACISSKAWICLSGFNPAVR